MFTYTITIVFVKEKKYGIRRHNFTVTSSTTTITKMASNISTQALTATPTSGPTTPITTSSTSNKVIRIRRATAKDARQISQLGTVVFTATFGASGCTPEQLQKYLDESYSVDAIRADLEDPDKTTLVSFDDHPPPTTTAASSSSTTSDGKIGDDDGATITGFALLKRGSSSSEPAITSGHYAKPVELQRLYVGMGSHGRGIGKALMNEMERLARSEGWEHMWLGVWEENFKAQKMYGKLGYQRIGEHLFDVGGDPQCDWILVKKL